MWHQAKYNVSYHAELPDDYATILGGLAFGKYRGRIDVHWVEPARGLVGNDTRTWGVYLLRYGNWADWNDIHSEYPLPAPSQQGIPAQSIQPGAA